VPDSEPSELLATERGAGPGDGCGKCAPFRIFPPFVPHVPSIAMQRLIRSELARHLNVSPVAVARATRRGEPCEGYPVAEWAMRRGRQVLYEVPEEAITEITKTDAAYLKRQSRVLRVFMRGEGQ